MQIEAGRARPTMTSSRTRRQHIEDTQTATQPLLKRINLDYKQPRHRNGDENFSFFCDFLWIHRLGFYILSNGCIRKLPIARTVLVVDCTLPKKKRKVALVIGSHWITTLIFLVKTETPPPRRWWCGRRGGPRALGFEI